jgi:hypothetical protein
MLGVTTDKNAYAVTTVTKVAQGITEIRGSGQAIHLRHALASKFRIVVGFDDV